MTAQERRIEILDYLSANRKATAPELAEHFHVKRLTILRDIDELSRLGYPVYTVQGNGGGIKVMEGCELHRRNLKQKEEEALRKILEGRPTDENDLQQIRNILRAFSSQRYL